MTPPEQIRTARLLLRKPHGEDASLMFTAYAQDSGGHPLSRGRPRVVREGFGQIRTDWRHDVRAS